MKGQIEEKEISFDWINFMYFKFSALIFSITDRLDMQFQRRVKLLVI